MAAAPVASDISRGAAALAAALKGTDLRFAIAESCTGGQLAALFARNVALGPHLDRGLVGYSIDAKCELLGVTREDATRTEGVNADCAAAMADGALARSDADVAIAITGFCGPQEEAEEVGLVHLACAMKAGGRLARECHFGDLGRDAVLDHSVAAALALLTESVAGAAVPILPSDKAQSLHAKDVE
jgi:nicotinamide-nucleotide amidase